VKLNKFIMSDHVNDLKKEILNKTKEYYRLVHDKKKTVSTPGKTKICYAGRVFDENEMVNLIDAALEFWLTEGRFTAQFENKLAKKLGIKYSLLVNSGSSANLLAFATLTSPVLEERQIKRNDEVITVAACFPTTVAPIINYGATPVFVDVRVDDGSYNINCDMLVKALSKKTKAVMLAHTMGNPFDIKRVKSFCDENKLWLIEDNCDSLGSEYENQYTGTFGDIATSSFYASHHITTGEGGAVYTNNYLLYKIARSFRDWGRDCFCPSGKDNCCGNRFSQKLGELPYGYDHKYIYSHFGYNLKATDLQAAIGCAQLDKLDEFTTLRQRNWQILRDGLSDLSDIFILPEAIPNSLPSWFGFLLTLKQTSLTTREEIVNYLEDHNIQTRMLFAGNLLRHPCFNQLREQNAGFKVVETLNDTDFITERTFWIGVSPGLSNKELHYMIKVIKDFVNKKLQI